MSVYKDFIFEFGSDGCWNCGWKYGVMDPKAWHVKLSVCHIIGGSGRRKKDRRAIVLLCEYPCHRLSHGDRIVIDGTVLPPLTLANMLWLKQKHDPDNYDPEWLASLWHGGLLPEPERPRF